MWNFISLPLVLPLLVLAQQGQPQPGHQFIVDQPATPKLQGQSDQFLQSQQGGEPQVGQRRADQGVPVQPQQGQQFVVDQPPNQQRQYGQPPQGQAMLNQHPSQPQHHPPGGQVQHGQPQMREQQHFQGVPVQPSQIPQSQQAGTLQGQQQQFMTQQFQQPNINSPPGVPTHQGQPQVGHPQMVQPQMGQPGQPQVGHPQMVQPQMGQPRMVHPQVGQPKMVHPQAGHPQMVHPQAGHPQMVHPQAGQPQMVPQGQPVINHDSAFNPDAAIDDGGGWLDSAPGVAMEYKVHVDAAKEDCYWQYVHTGATFYVSSQVLKGGDGNIGVGIRQPSGKLVHQYQWKANAEYEESSALGGYYSVCLDNQFSKFSAKLVNLYITTFRYDEWEKFSDELKDMDMSVSNFTTILTGVDKRVQVMRQFQQLSRGLESRDYNLLIANLNYVTNWSIIQCVVVVLCGLVQVYFVRRLFASDHTSKRVRP